MVQIQLIISEIMWNRKLEFEEDRRKSHRVEPYVNYLAPLQPTQKEQNRQPSQAPLNFIPALTGLLFSQSCEYGNLSCSPIIRKLSNLIKS